MELKYPPVHLYRLDYALTNPYAFVVLSQLLHDHAGIMHALISDSLSYLAVNYILMQFLLVLMVIILPLINIYVL